MGKICEICENKESVTKFYSWRLCQDCVQSWAEYMHKQKNNYCDWDWWYRPLFDNWKNKKLKKFKRIKKKGKSSIPFERWDILDL